MNIKTLQTGEYQITSVFQQFIDGKMIDCAEAYYKQFSSNHFSNNTCVIKIGSLYNNVSIGPKHIEQHELIYGIVTIDDLRLLPERCVTWRFESSTAFEELKDVHGEFEMDALLQHQEQEALLQEIVDGNLIDELEYLNQAESTVIGDQRQTDREKEDQAF